ncbi:AAC(3) family N-acetyltransferase [Paracoccus sp. p4-l81]|uniref:AAC(3) family N-acetyltransferase n=1 Tax=Paracoccus sp. p4-l81 TaxID=3342806 RepID=UPI0035BAF046
MTDFGTLADRWRGAGIAAGDTVLVHSSIKRTLHEAREAGHPLGPQEILASLLDAVGAKGTLVLPLFNFGFAGGRDFDIRSTPSEMGALTECGRLHPDAIRAGHPIYSFAAIGANSAAFAGVDNESGYAEDSPFGILRRLDGKIAVLDLPDQNSMTFYHHVEEMRQVSCRYFKTFTGNYVDAEGRMSVRSYRLFVRDIENGVLTHVNPAGEIAWEKGLYSGDRPGCGSGMRVIRAQDMFDLTAWLIDTGQAEDNLFRREKA